jgi:hypothetical protein
MKDPLFTKKNVTLENIRTLAGKVSTEWLAKRFYYHSRCILTLAHTPRNNLALRHGRWSWWIVRVLSVAIHSAVG